MKTALFVVMAFGTALVQVTSSSPPPQVETRLKTRIDAAVAKTGGGALWAGGQWNRWIVVGGIDGNTEGVYYYTADAAKYGTPSASHAFHIGSLTKAFTGALLALQEGPGMRVGACCARTRGKTKLSAKLASACGADCTALPPPRDDITIEQLAIHRSGLPRRITVAACNSTQLFQSLTSFQINATSPPGCIAGEDPASTGENAGCHVDKPCFAPGHKYLYSNWGFYTLGALLAHDAGYTAPRDYNDLLRDKLLTPYGMAQTFGGDEDVPPGTTKAPDWECRFGHGPANERYLICPEEAHANPNTRNTAFPQHGSGHLWSTGPDMLKFLRFAMGRPPLEGNRRVVKAMHEARKLLFCDRAEGPQNDDGTPGQIGLGWNHTRTGEDLLWWKGGDAGFFHSYIGFSPSKDVGVFVLANTDVDEPDQVARTFLGYY